jgi:hypothetical protein
MVAGMAHGTQREARAYRLDDWLSRRPEPRRNSPSLQKSSKVVRLDRSEHPSGVHPRILMQAERESGHPIVAEHVDGDGKHLARKGTNRRLAVDDHLLPVVLRRSSDFESPAEQ